MKYVLNGLKAAFLLALCFGQANAQVVNFTLSGNVTDTYGSNPFGLSIGNTITATGSFDGTGFSDSNWGFDYTDLIDITFTVGTGEYTLADADFWGAEIVFLDNAFYDLDYSSEDGQFFSSYTLSQVTFITLKATGQVTL